MLIWPDFQLVNAQVSACRTGPKHVLTRSRSRSKSPIPKPREAQKKGGGGSLRRPPLEVGPAALEVGGEAHEHIAAQGVVDLGIGAAVAVAGRAVRGAHDRRIL